MNVWKKHAKILYDKMKMMVLVLIVLMTVCPMMGAFAKKEDKSSIQAEHRVPNLMTNDQAKNGELVLYSQIVSTSGEHQNNQKNFVTDFDKNNDDVVSANEFFGPKEIFKLHDKNGDGIVTRDEAELHHSQMDFIADFDKNNDGVVSVNEFFGPKEIFDQFDKNGDAKITRDEVESHHSRINDEVNVGEGSNGIIEKLIPLATGALFTDDFNGDDIDYKQWRLMPFINRDWVSLKEGALRIKGRLQRPQSNILMHNRPGMTVHLGLTTPRFPTADVVAVMRMKVLSHPLSNGKSWVSVLHVCNFRPDYFSEIRFGSQTGQKLVWNFASRDTMNIRTDGIGAFGDESDRYYTVKVERDGPSRKMTGYVEGPNGWVCVGKVKDTHLFASRIEVKAVTKSDDLNFDIYVDDIRLYPHPDRNRLFFVIMSSLTHLYPSPRSDALSLKLFHSDGKTIIGEGERLAADDPYAFSVALSREITFPIGAVIKLYYDTKEVGCGQIKSDGVNGLYPGDIWVISVRSSNI